MPREGFAIAKMAALGFLLLASVAPAQVPTRIIPGQASRQLAPMFRKLSVAKLTASTQGGTSITGTAFCVGPAGGRDFIFVSAGHAAEADGREYTRGSVRFCGPGECYDLPAEPLVLQNDDYVDLSAWKVDCTNLPGDPLVAPVEDTDPRAGEQLVFAGYPDGAYQVQAAKVTAEQHLGSFAMDASTRGGMSGAPVLNMSGSVVGVVVRTSYQPPRTYAIGTESLNYVLSQIGARITGVGGRDVPSVVSSPSGAGSSGGRAVSEAAGSEVLLAPGSKVKARHLSFVPGTGSPMGVCPTCEKFDEFAAEVDGRIGAIEGRVGGIEGSVSQMTNLVQQTKDILETDSKRSSERLDRIEKLADEHADAIPGLRADIDAEKAKPQQPAASDSGTPVVASDEAPMFAAMPSSTSGQILWLVKWGLMGGVAYLLIAKVIKPLVVFLVHLLRDAVEYIVERIARRVRGDHEEPKPAVTVNNTNPVL